MSPLGRSGGSQDMMIFVLDAGIALIACGAEGTMKTKKQQREKEEKENEQETNK